MTIIASCGHTLTDADGENGMGHNLCIKAYTREYTPALCFVSYCTSCRNDALASGRVLSTEAEQTAWCRTEQ